jgi:hypothetical protein
MASLNTDQIYYKFFYMLLYSIQRYIFGVWQFYNALKKLDIV